MKIKLYNGQQVSLSLRVLAGGYDQDSQKVVAIVGGEEGQAGTLTLDPSEARTLGELLATAPTPRVVEPDPPRELRTVVPK